MALAILCRGMLARIAGNGEFSDEILGAGREAVLGRTAAAKPAARKPARKKAVTSAQQ